MYKPPDYRDPDWLVYHSTSKVWAGKFKHVPLDEIVSMATISKDDKAHTVDDYLRAHAPAEVEGDEDDGGDEEKVPDKVMLELQRTVEMKNSKKFRPEQIASRYLVDLLLIYGKAWAVPPSRVSNPYSGTTVVDPFCGAGSTFIAAHLLDLPFIGMDIDPLANHLFHGSSNKKLAEAGTYEKIKASKKLQYEKVHETQYLIKHILSMYTPSVIFTVNARS
jgi:hypothetical protein